MALREAIEVTKECKQCKRLFTRMSKLPWHEKFCSDYCSDRDYRKRHKKSELERSRKWQKKNKQNVLEAQRRYYKKNKSIQDSRTRTAKLLKKYPHLLQKICHRCSSQENLETHHEIYPLYWEQMRIAIANKKIYFLCRDCHNAIPKK